MRVCASGGPLAVIPRIFPLFLRSLLMVWLLLCLTVRPPILGHCRGSAVAVPSVRVRISDSVV